MTAELKSSLVTSLEAAAAQAGLVLLSATPGSDFHGAADGGLSARPAAAPRAARCSSN